MPVRRALRVVVVALVLAAAGCANYAEVTSQSQLARPPGTSGTAGSIELRDAVLVGTEDGRRGTLYTVFANQGERDAVVSVRVGGVEVEPDGGPLMVPPLGSSALSPDATRLDVTGADTVPGYFVEVEYVFAVAPRITLEVLVFRDDGYYAGSLH